MISDFKNEAELNLNLKMRISSKGKKLVLMVSWRLEYLFLLRNLDSLIAYQNYIKEKLGVLAPGVPLAGLAFE